MIVFDHFIIASKNSYDNHGNCENWKENVAYNLTNLNNVRSLEAVDLVGARNNLKWVEIWATKQGKTSLSTKFSHHYRYAVAYAGFASLQYSHGSTWAEQTRPFARHDFDQCVW